MVRTVDLSVRVQELEREIEQLRAERAGSSPDGSMLKALLDDIERRRAIEDQLRDAHQWLDLAQRAGSVAAYTFDFASQKLDWSPSTMELYGFDDDCCPTLASWLASIHVDDLSAVQRVADDALSNGVDVDQRFRIVRPDGSIRWVQDRARIIRGEDGKPSRLAGINIDVTELIELQAAYATESERLRIAMEAGRLSCWDWDLASNQVVWDENLSRYAGLEQFGGTFDSFWAMVHEDDKPTIRAALDAALAGEAEYSVEFRMWRADGTIRWTSTRAKLVTEADGRPLRMVGIDADITDRKVAEAKVLSHEQFLASVLDVSTDCVKVVELDGSLSYMNPNGLCAMELDSFAAIDGQCWSGLWPAETASLVEQAVAQARLGHKSRFEGFCPTAKGTGKWWDVAVAPMIDAEGKVVRIVSLSRDITERREKEEQLALLNRELHHRVKNNLATIQAIARATTRESSSVEDFTARFDARLVAVAQTHDLLLEGGDATTVGDLLMTELGPFLDGSIPLVIEGPPLAIGSAEALAFGMIFHELTTNAVKYGGLSPTGAGLAVRWRVIAEPSSSQVSLEWIERKASAEPVKIGEGFGTRLIQRLVRRTLRGTVESHFDGNGGRVLIQFAHH